MFGFFVSLWHLYWAFASDVHTWLWHTAPEAGAFLLASLRDMLYPFAALTALFGGLMAHPRTRRTTMAVIKFTNRHSPSWARYAMALAALVPGQFDEIVLVAFLLIPILRIERNRVVLGRILRYPF